MRIIITGDTATISASRKEAKRLGLVLGESYFSHDEDDLRARTGLAPKVVLQVRQLLTMVATKQESVFDNLPFLVRVPPPDDDRRILLSCVHRINENQFRVVAPLFGVEQVAAPDQARSVDLELVIDGDTVTVRLARAGLRALGKSARVAIEDLSRASYYIRVGVAQADVLGLIDVMTSEAVSSDVTIPFRPGQEEVENPPRPRRPPPPGTVRPSSRFARFGPYLFVYDRDEGEWVPEGGLRGGWVIPQAAPRPRPKNMSIFELDMIAQPDLRMAPQPDALYRTSLPGEVEADCYTDPAGQVCYIETVPGTAATANPTLDLPQVSTTYVIHPDDGRFAVVLRTDERARLVEVVADPVAPVGSYGPGGHPLVELLGGWPGQVSLASLIRSLGVSAVERLGQLGAWLSEAVGRGQHVWVRLQPLYDGASAVPAGIQADWSIDGQAATESFPNT